MAKIYNSSDISLEFKPWTDDDSRFRITRLQMTERLGGEMAHGEIDLIHVGKKQSEKFVTDQNTGTVILTDEKPGGLSYTTDVYITYREYYRNVLKLKFVCVGDIEFLTKRVTQYLPISIPLKKKIESLFPGKVDWRDTEPDVPDIDIYQNCETNYELCRRLCYSYLGNSIFMFGWDGLTLKEMCGLRDHKGNQEPKMELEANRLMKQYEPYNMSYDKLQNYSPILPWAAPEDSTTQTDYTEYDSKYFDIHQNYKQYKVVGKEHSPYLVNAWSNSRRMEYPGFTHFKLVSSDMPHYKLGDCLKDYDRAEQVETIPWHRYLVVSNEVYFTTDAADNQTDEHGFRFSWISYFYGMDGGIWNSQK